MIVGSNFEVVTDHDLIRSVLMLAMNFWTTPTRYRPTAAELAATRFTMHSYARNTPANAQDSLARATRDYARGWMTEREFAWLAYLCIEAGAIPPSTNEDRQ